MCPCVKERVCAGVGGGGEAAGGAAVGAGGEMDEHISHARASVCSVFECEVE